MPPKGKKRSQSIGGLEDPTIAGLPQAPPTISIPAHKVINNKSGPPTPLTSSPSPKWQQYTPTVEYMQGKDKYESQKAPTWVTVWMWITTIIVTWDCSYILTRPWLYNTDIGHAIWWPYYNKYGKMDRFYGPEGWQAYLDGKEGWNFSQSIMNAVEILFQMWYLYLHSVRDAAAPVWALVVSVSTCIKTVLYFLVTFNGDYKHLVPASVCAYDSAAATSQDCKDFVLYVFVNGIWIVVPALVVYTIGAKLAKANSK